MSELRKEIGKRIRVARENADMTQGELAEAIGASRTSVTNIESGLQKIPLEKLYDIASVLATSIFELLPDEIDETELKRINKIRTISSKIAALREEQRQLRREGKRPE